MDPGNVLAKWDNSD